MTSAGGTTLHSGSIAKSFRIRPARCSTRLQHYSKPSSYDRYRGVLRIVASTKVDVINELPLESYLRGVVPAEMPSTGTPGAQGADGRRAVVRRAPAAAGRLDVSTSMTTRARRSTRACCARAASTNTSYGNGGQGRQERLVDREHVLPLDRRRRDGEQRERLRVVLRGEGGRPVSYLRGSSDRAPDGKPYDASSPYISWKTATYTRSQLSSWLAGDSRTNVGNGVGSTSATAASRGG